MGAGQRGPAAASPARAGLRPAGLGAGTALMLAVALALGASQALAEDGFAQCVARLRSKAEAGGISRATAESVLATVRERPQVIAADQRQPEFVETLGAYLGRRVTATRIAAGRALAMRYAPLLARLEREYGVPPQYLIAFWGLETDYGRVLGDLPVFDSLATLACDTRRGEYFAGELVNALRIVDRGDVTPATMTGSWAGAMGHTQFMQSVYLEDAVDGDGDGAVDLWRSVPDAFASAANFLRDLGWTRGWRWGREVVLPTDFDYFRAGSSTKRASRTGAGPVSARPTAASSTPRTSRLPCFCRPATRDPPSSSMRTSGRSCAGTGPSSSRWRSGVLRIGSRAPGRCARRRPTSLPSREARSKRCSGSSMRAVSMPASQTASRARQRVAPFANGNVTTIS